MGGGESRNAVDGGAGWGHSAALVDGKFFILLIFFTSGLASGPCQEGESETTSSVIRQMLESNLLRVGCRRRADCL